MKSIIQKWRLWNNIILKGQKSFIAIDRNTKIILGKNASIKINNGCLKVGGNHPKSAGLPTLNKTLIVLEKNSQLIVDDDVFI